jgi:hypothetical protein
LRGLRAEVDRRLDRVRDEVVHNVAHVALHDPARLVLATAVLKMQDGIVDIAVSVVTGGGRT